jgi:hypothetical protein
MPSNDYKYSITSNDDNRIMSSNGGRATRQWGTKIRNEHENLATGLSTFRPAVLGSKSVAPGPINIPVTVFESLGRE